MISISIGVKNSYSSSEPTDSRIDTFNNLNLFFCRGSLLFLHYFVFLF